MALGLILFVGIAAVFSIRKRDTKQLAKDGGVCIYERARAQFSFFKAHPDLIFMENAGGSQVPDCVIDAMSRYMRTLYVQLQAGYHVSAKATEVVDTAHKVMRTFMGADETGQIILGASTSQLLFMLAQCYGNKLQPGDEIVIQLAAHEANAGPWEQLKSRGVLVRVWTAVDDEHVSHPETLVPLLNLRTKLVCVVHVSNILGAILDVKAVSLLVSRYSPQAHIVVDGVAYAPHRPIHFGDWNIHHYVFSSYKVMCGHMAVLCSSLEAMQHLSGPNHFFIDDHIPYKFELGGSCHEGCAGICALPMYMRSMLDTTTDTHTHTYQIPDALTSPLTRTEVTQFFDLMIRMEAPLQQTLIAYLTSNQGVRLIGPRTADPALRVCTISFTHTTLLPSAIVAHLHTHNIAVRNGHMYAYRLIESLEGSVVCSMTEGVVRISLLHYNTPNEVDTLIQVLDMIL